MATKTLGTNATTSLTALAFGGGPVIGSGDTGYSEADIAAIDQLIIGDHATNQGVHPTGTTTTSSASITAISSMASIRAGMLIFGPGIPPGTIIASVNVGASSLVMSAPIVGAGAAGVNLLITPITAAMLGSFSKMGLLYVPNRGTLIVKPGDWVGVDAAGWPILVGVGAIAFANSSWTHS